MAVDLTSSLKSLKGKASADVQPHIQKLESFYEKKYRFLGSQEKKRSNVLSATSDYTIR